MSDFNNKKLYYIQHVPFETPAKIFDWCVERRIEIKGFFAYNNDLSFLNPEECDILLIMGGSMGVYDEVEYPWLKEEKIMIEKAIRLNKKVIGICLGAQLIACVLGAKVYKNQYKEIGWFPVYSTAEAKHLWKDLPSSFTPFHWHGDTFDLPLDSIHLFYNEVTKHQGFIYKNALALQFHLESTEESIIDIYKNASADLNVKDKSYIKEYNEKENQLYMKDSHSVLFKVLDNFIN